MLVAQEENNNFHVVDIIIDKGCRRSSVSGGGGEGCSDEEELRYSNERGGEIVEKEMGSSVSECSVEMVDLESGVGDDIKVQHLIKVERECRICHLSMDMTNNLESGGSHIELGCSCKDDLAAAHKQCAEAWFKIKGNITCEICGSIARNVASAVEVGMTEQWNEANDASVVPPTGPPPSTETRNFWQGHRFLNFLLACMVFAFVISWLFHFNVPS